MADEWQRILRIHRIPSEEIRRITGITPAEYQQIQRDFPIQINRWLHPAAIVPEHPVWKQFLPDKSELDYSGEPDPLQEESHRKGVTILHRYPNRVLFLLASRCASYCRFCTRRRLVGKQPNPSPAQIQAGLEYVARHPKINEVILSGGDPLLLRDEKLEEILQQLRRIEHLDVIRLSTRTLLTLPQRITSDLIALLKKSQPIYVITQFNHPQEFTSNADQAIAALIDQGIPVLNQSVLLKGVNDDARTMLALVRELVKRRVRPYYLHQLDPARGTLHFQVPVKKGIEIITFLRKKIGGYAVPLYVCDDPSRPAKTILAPRFGRHK